MPGPFAQVSAAPMVMRSSAPSLDMHSASPFTRRPAVAVKQDSGGRQPLDGVKVLDFGWILAGPYSSRMLADYGATVVKVESASRLDLLRLLGPYYSTRSTPENSASFASTAAGKQGLSIDLANPAARTVILDLVRWADVVSESFAPGAMERLGLDYETLRAIKPELVMVSSSLFGQTGPYAALPGFGTQGAAVAGLVLPTGYPDRAPCGPYGPFTDYVAPRYQFLATLAALEHRDRTGEGTYIDISQAETGLHAMAVALARSSLDGTILDREANTDPAMRPHGIYRSAGADEWIAIAARDARDWTALCDVIGKPELALAPPANDIADVITAWTSERSAEDAERQLQQAGVPAHHVVNSTTAPADAHLVARDMFLNTRLGDRDALVTSTGYHFNSGPPRVGPVPRLGEHSVTVLRDHLGYSADTIDALLASGVITTPS
jgi:crotonobetainyl-CoA:carnitine CoA-transferase CaiB-like acyl-CoA transferase